MNNKPDVVYLWVDGSDPAWRAKRLRDARRHQHDLAYRYANVEGRFRDNDELRYSLRALTPHLHQFGTIYLVTDHQKPSWLKDHQQIKLIAHSDFRFNLGSTYSSRALEADLHHIPGLADRFLYFNDDVFVGGAFDLHHFFESEKSIHIHFEPQKDAKKPDEPHATAGGVSCALLSQILPHLTHSQNPFAHAPRAIFKPAMHELEALLPEAFEQARQEVFRQPQTPSVLADLYPRWMQATGRAAAHDAPHQLLCSGEPDFADQLSRWQSDLSQLSFFCVNDTLDDAPTDHPNLDLLRASLAKIYPQPSPFE